MIREVEHIFERLRQGAVPDRGLEHFAIGIDKSRAELRRQMDLAEQEEGGIKFLRGGYGCGKTFMARMATLDAQERGFATSFVVVSDNDLHFYKFDDVYRKVMMQLATKTCPRGAFGDILDQWIGKVEDALIELGENEEADDFDDKVNARLNEELLSLTGGEAPQDFVRVIQAIFQLKQEGNYADAGALLSWLSGSSNVAASAKKHAKIKGDITSRDALDYLRGVLAIIKAVGYKGLVIVIDEVETVLRMRSDIRNKSLNGLRQIHDAAPEFPGLLWLFTGTKEFFDNRKGVAGLEPLHQRIQFQKQGSRASLRQPQLELSPFDKERLQGVAIRLRSIFPANNQHQMEQRVSNNFIEQLVDKVTEGFHGDVGVIPRQFLREIVGVMDLVDEHDDFDPIKEYNFAPKGLTDAEQAAMEQKKLDEASAELDDDLVPTEDVW
jgi:hypothetical protein